MQLIQTITQPFTQAQQRALHAFHAFESDIREFGDLIGRKSVTEVEPENFVIADKIRFTFALLQSTLNLVHSKIVKYRMGGTGTI